MDSEVYERDVDSEPSDIEIEFSLDKFDEANIYQNELGESYNTLRGAKGKRIKRTRLNIKRNLDIKEYIIKIDGEPNYKKRLDVTLKIFDVLRDKNLSILIGEMVINSYYLGCTYKDQDIIDFYIEKLM